MIRLAPLLLLLPVAACGQKTPKPPPATQPAAPAASAKPAPPPTPPPATVPAAFAQQIEAAWPGLEKRAADAQKHFDAAVKAKNAGDRTALKAEVDAGAKLYNGLIEEWAGLTYAIEDMTDQRQKDACWNWIAAKEKTSKGWRDRAQALKNLSTQ